MFNDLKRETTVSDKELIYIPQISLGTRKLHLGRSRNQAGRIKTVKNGTLKFLAFEIVKLENLYC